MAVKTHLVDPFTKAHAKINSEGALLTVSRAAPLALDAGTENSIQYLFGKLGSTGFNSGLTTANVDGSVTPQRFYVGSDEEFDIHIMQITALIADSAVTHQAFGNVTTLANGWDLILTESGINTPIIDKAQTGGQAIVQSGFSKSFGGGAEAFELINWSGNTDAQAVNIPIGSFIPGGLRIGRGTNDKLESVVNDNLTGLTDFIVYIYGYKNIPTSE